MSPRSRNDGPSNYIGACWQAECLRFAFHPGNLGMLMILGRICSMQYILVCSPGVPEFVFSTFGYCHPHSADGQMEHSKSKQTNVVVACSLAAEAHARRLEAFPGPSLPEVLQACAKHVQDRASLGNRNHKAARRQHLLPTRRNLLARTPTFASSHCAPPSHAISRMGGADDCSQASFCPA